MRTLDILTIGRTPVLTGPESDRVSSDFRYDTRAWGARKPAFPQLRCQLLHQVISDRTVARLSIAGTEPG